MRNFALNIGGQRIPLPGQIGNLEFQSAGSGKYAYGGYIIAEFVTLLVLFAVFICAFTILFGGFKWLRSQGDPKRIEEARTTIIYAFLGLMITFLSFFIIRYILGFFLIRIF